MRSFKISLRLGMNLVLTKTGSGMKYIYCDIFCNCIATCYYSISKSKVPFSDDVKITHEQITLDHRMTEVKLEQCTVYLYSIHVGVSSNKH